MKRTLNELAVFGGEPLFAEIKSTSNLVQPDRETFFSYLEKSFHAGEFDGAGPVCDLLERKIEELHEVKHCVAVCNGLWALVYAIKLLIDPQKSEIVMPSLTYRRMGDIAAWVNLTPRYCEVEETSLAIDIASVESCITAETALILAPHPLVNLCNIDALEMLAKKYQLPLLFDSVEASFSSYKGKMVGGFGNAECFSMHASKFINGFEGGFVTTNDTALAKELRGLVKGQGQFSDGSMAMDMRLVEAHAALGLANFDEIEQQISANKARYNIYQQALAKIDGLRLVEYDDFDARPYKNIVCELTDTWPITREQTINLMHAEKMLVRAYYWPPLHEKKTTYRTIGENLSLSSELSKRFLNLPSGDFLSTDDVFKVCEFLAFISQQGDSLKRALESLK